MRVRLVNENYKENYIRNLLKERGIESIEEFVRPTESFLEPPELLDEIDKAARLLSTILTIKGRIGIIVDCDVDGFTSAAIMYQYLKRLVPDIIIDYFLHEGKQHGLEDQIDNLMESDTIYDLLIVPDAGSNDFEYCERLATIGTPVLILDHHLVDREISPNAVVVNNQSSISYENKDLTGAGVVYQFCRYLDKFFKADYANDYIDLAALGILSDMGSVLQLENRYIIYEGLKNVKNYFFKNLAEKQAYSITKGTGTSWADIQASLNPISVTFYITPLINAMIRVGTMEEKERLFSAFIDGHRKVVSHKRGANGALEEVAIESARECVNARSHQNKAKDKAIEQIKVKIFNNNLLDNKILFVELDEEDDFPSELNGLIAMGLVAEYKKPTMLGRLGPDGLIKGSCRGLNDNEFNDFKGYLTKTELCEYAQGHANAFGYAVSAQKVQALINKSNEDLMKFNFNEDFYNVNFLRSAADEDLGNLIADISEYSNIWGIGNSTPLIYIRDINITPNDVKVMGKNKDAVKIEKFGISYVKTYGAKDLIEELTKYPEMKVEVVGEANMNYWCGRANPQIMIKSIEVKNGHLGF